MNPRLSPHELTRVLRALLHASGMLPARAGVAAVSDARMRALKDVYLPHHDDVVNILAFREPKDFPHPESPFPFLGELFVNRRFLARNSREDSIRLIAHGLLHLLGYGHERPKDRRRMETAEQRILQKVFPMRGRVRPRRGAIE